MKIPNQKQSASANSGWKKYDTLRLLKKIRQMNNFVIPTKSD